MEEKLRDREIDNEFMGELKKENPSFAKLKELLKAGADINSVFYIYRTNCLMDLINIWPAYFKEDINRAKNILEFMIDNGANINHLDDLGSSVIHTCVDAGNIEILKYFLDKGVSPNYVCLWMGTPLDQLERSVILDKEFYDSTKYLLKSRGAKSSFELKSNQVSKYLKIDFTSYIELCFMSGNGYISISDIPGADETEISELISLYKSFCKKEIIDLKSEEHNIIKDFNDRGLRLVKSIISNLAPNVYIYFHHINIFDSGNLLKYEKFVDKDTEFGLFEFQIPYNERKSPF